MPHLTLLDLAARSKPMASKWIKGAIKHKGALKADAKRAGESTHEYAEAHKHDSGKTGARSRLALTLMGMHHGGREKKRGTKESLFNRSR